MERDTGSAGQGEYEVQYGDCIDSIAYDHGHFWETIWEHPDNRELKDLRGDPNVLCTGDLVTTPPLRKREESCEVESRHRFRRKGVPAELSLQICRFGEPRANEAFRLEIDGVATEGTLDDEGRLKVGIAPNAKECELFVGENRDEYPIELGGLDPISETSGLKARLNNIGFACGEADDEMTDDTRAAIAQFQAAHELEKTGKPDQNTCDKIVEIHGS